MRSLSNIGRIFYAIAMAGIGFEIIYSHDFPYWLLPPKHSWIPGLAIVAYIFGIMFVLTGACIVLEKKIRTVSLLAGTVLLLIFCFYFIPYQFMASSRYMHLLQWENAEKELAFCSGAFVIAGCYSETNEKTFYRFLGKLIPFGPVLFSIPIISFGILHILYAKDVADYVPSWAPARLFWAYFCGAALIGSGLAIILKIKPGPAATLLGIMIFIWVIILHIPRVIASPVAYMGSEVTSALIALAYSGIAFVIAGATKKTA
jgi:uncharacterized membrane protein